jgi:N-acetylglucosaminyldiphosphoundecaprenol N-acetyl-beta-D-mannosaminyltransferase
MSAAPQLQSVPRRRAAALRPVNMERLGIGHALVDNCSFQQAQAAIIDHAVADGECAYVITPNAQHIVLLDQDPHLREIFQHAGLVVPDDVSLLLAARLFGRSFKERVTGVDLFQSLCACAAEKNLRVFLLGGRLGSAERAASRLRERHPGLQIAASCLPQGFENDPARLARAADLIRAAKPNLLFVGLGAPKQEYWIYEHGRQLGANVHIGVGGSFDVVGSIVRRAPHWVRSIGCEWLYRLLQEPRRMWRRYLIGNIQFLIIVLQQRLARNAAPVPSSQAISARPARSE